MKYCNDCKVYAWEGLSNCPLCGAHLEPADENAPALYAAMDETVQRPKVKYRSETAFMKKKSLILILIAIAAAVIINLLASPTSLWSGYAAVGGFVAYFGVLRVLINKKRLHSVLTGGALVSAIAVLAVDFIQSLDRGGDLSKICFALPYAVPGIFIGVTVALDVLALCNRRSGRYYFSSLFVVALYSLLPQIAVWAFSIQIKTFLTLACFYFAVFNTLVMTIAFYGKMKAELSRKMHF